MIFVTVGSELAFDRMLSVIDAWAVGSEEDVVAQIGSSELRPAHIRHKQFLSPDEFRQHVRDCSVMVAHAGMGSILTAMEYAKPIIIMPRRERFHETRNDHQVATAKQFMNHTGIYIAMDETQLRQKLERINTFVAGNAVSQFASDKLLTSITRFIDG